MQCKQTYFSSKGIRSVTSKTINKLFTLTNGLPLPQFSGLHRMTYQNNALTKIKGLVLLGLVTFKHFSSRFSPVCYNNEPLQIFLVSRWFLAREDKMKKNMTTRIIFHSFFMNG